jgi:hypothetical protein
MSIARNKNKNLRGATSTSPEKVSSPSLSPSGYPDGQRTVLDANLPIDAAR